MDALSSQATVSGYRGTRGRAAEQVLPHVHDRRGDGPPAKVLVHGRGRGGPPGHRHGPAPRRPGTGLRRARGGQGGGRGLGATFVELGLRPGGGRLRPRAVAEEFLARQQEPSADEVAASDVVITTAAVPGRKAPILVTTAMVERDGRGLGRDRHGGRRRRELRADRGRRGRRAPRRVRVVGLTQPPRRMPTHASFLYARNVVNLLALFGRRGRARPGLGRRDRRRHCVRARRRGRPRDRPPSCLGVGPRQRSPTT